MLMTHFQMATTSVQQLKMNVISIKVSWDGVTAFALWVVIANEATSQETDDEGCELLRQYS